MNKSYKPIGCPNDVISLRMEIWQKRKIAEKSYGARKYKYEKWTQKLLNILKGKIKATETLGMDMAYVRAILIKANRAKNGGNIELFSDLIKMTVVIVEKIKISDQIFLECSDKDVLALLKKNPERVVIFKAGKIMKIKIKEVKKNNKF